MPDLPSRQAYVRIGLDEIRATNPRLDPAQADVAGTDVNVVLASAAAMAEEVQRQQAIAFANLLLGSATGEALARLVFDRYGIEVFGAQSAVGTVQFTRATATAGAGTLASGFRVATSDGIEYETTQAATFGPLALVSSPPSVGVRAIVAGAATQVAQNRLTIMRSVAFDTTIAVNNAAATAGGSDRETDDQLRARAIDVFVSARRGTPGAIEAGARSVAGIRFAVAVEAVDEFAFPARFVDLFAADASGTMNGALAALVRNALLEFRAAGIFVRVNDVLPTFVDIRLRLAFSAGTDTVTATTLVRAAVVNAVNQLAPNATLRIATLTEAIRAIAGVIAPTDGAGASGGVLAPVGDLVPAAGRTIRTTLDRVTVE